MKFGKYLEVRQLELADCNGHFVDYKALKKLIKALGGSEEHRGTEEHAASNHDDDDDDGCALDPRRLRDNKATFFFKLERELEKVNDFYLAREAALRIKFNILQRKYRDSRHSGKLSSRQSLSFRALYAGLANFQKDLSNLQQYVELNKIAFAKALKKWDKRSLSHDKEFYLATVVSVQPIFTRDDPLKWNDETQTILMELNGANISSEVPIDEFASSEIDLSSNKDLDLDLVLEDWYTEILNIATLKDEAKKLHLIQDYNATKIMPQIMSLKVDDDKRKVVHSQLMTKLLLILISSNNVNDVLLQEFYNCIKDHTDFHYHDEEEQIFSKPNVIHEAASCAAHSRVFIVEDLYAKEPEFKCLLNSKDLMSRTPLHYASELGKTDMVHFLLSTGQVDLVDALDNDSRTPLILAIINNHIEIVSLLISRGGACVTLEPSDQKQTSNPIDPVSSSRNAGFDPLIVACETNNPQAAELILMKRLSANNIVCPIAEMGPLHVVAQRGGDKILIDLLVNKGGIDPNSQSGSSKWTPIFYAIISKHTETVIELLRLGADLNVSDKEGKSPLFYAIWESNISVLNALMTFSSGQISNKSRSPHVTWIDAPNSKNDLVKAQHDGLHIKPTIAPVSVDNGDISSINDLRDTFEDIPDFSLPPPVIPLRKYGHNFLEKKIFVKIKFKDGNSSVSLNKENEAYLNKPGRITVTSNESDIMPRNVILPVRGNPLGGPSIEDEIDQDDGEVLFQVDSLDNFQLDFEVFPIYGTKLIAKTTTLPSLFSQKLVNGVETAKLPLMDSKLSNVGHMVVDFQVIYPYMDKPLQIAKYKTYWKSTGNNNKSNISSISTNNSILGGKFVTGSSLKNSFVNVKVCQLNDDTLVAAPEMYFVSGQVKILLNDLNLAQLEMCQGYKIGDVPNFRTQDSLVQGLSTTIYAFKELLENIPGNIQLIIDVCFPTVEEVCAIPVKISPYLDINRFIDDMFFTIFEHERNLKHRGVETRSIIFSSSNWQACAILNWKQPNFPVFLSLTGIKRIPNGEFSCDTSHNLASMCEDPSRLNSLQERDLAVHNMVKYAVNNNLLGVIIPQDILGLSISVSDTIRRSGLLLVAINSQKNQHIFNEHINGIHIESELIFNDSVSDL